MAITDKITAVADAIRAKTGSTAQLTLDQMPAAIASIDAYGNASAQLQNLFGSNYYVETGSFVQSKDDYCLHYSNFHYDFHDNSYNTKIYAMLVWTNEDLATGIKRMRLESNWDGVSISTYAYNEGTDASGNKFNFNVGIGISYGATGVNWAGQKHELLIGGVTYHYLLVIAK